MHMVKRADQLNMSRQQHAVAEHVASHVANPHHGEVCTLDVDTQFSEVSLHRLPTPARRDAHLLMVVASGTTRGEGIAEPEPVVLRHAIGDIRKRGSTLVSRDHQVGVIFVVPHHIFGRNYCTALQVVGNVEHAGDESCVAGHNLFCERFTITTNRWLFNDKATL